jgi:iron complex outermembrane receptor protein
MSELIDTQSTHAAIRWNLLATVSTIALLGMIASSRVARADENDADNPTVWIEFGGQVERATDAAQQFAPPFVLSTPRPAFETISPLDATRGPRYDIGGEDKITFQPRGTDWVFSAVVRYGRANGNKHAHQQTYPQSCLTSQYAVYHGHAPAYVAKFADAKARASGSSAVLDFQAGKDVGLGIFGHRGTSVLGFGVRFAQFSSKSSVMFKSDPDWHRVYVYNQYFHRSLFHGQEYHSNIASFGAERNFRGVGPSIKWDASAPFVGSVQNGEITLDWGTNAALLFGRQHATTNHQTTAFYHSQRGAGYGYHALGRRVTLYQYATAHSRGKSVVVPNVGGFAGLSVRYAAAKLSLGYRADFFFGAMDGGLDMRKSGNVVFYGPFASISVGLGE